MKHTFFLFLLVFLAACNSAPRPEASSNTNTAQPGRSEPTQSVLAHGTENQTPKPANSGSGKWSQSGDPIDTTTYDDVIAGSEGSLKKGGDERAAKVALAQAYFDRGFALTEARQYASALGDYRRALKLNPEHEEAKKWLDQIVGIYTMLKKEPPKEGEEPPPLPFKKTT